MRLRNIIPALPLVALAACANVPEHLAADICASSPHCYVHDTGPTYGPPQQVLIEPKKDGAPH